MISPHNASVDYGTMLKAPAGYAVDFAICTTYSLDLHALMGAYLSLGLSVDTDSSLAKDPMYLFAALSEMQGKIIVFCEKGRIYGRGEYSALYCQLESSIVEVDLPDASTAAGHFAYPSFHPKTWIIRFTPVTGTGPAKYRMCTLSRNLTFDSSWDLAAAFDGEYREVHKRASEGGYSIQAYLKNLRKLYGAGELSTKLETAINEIAYVNFSSSEKSYQLALPFSFTGVPGAKSFDDEFSRALKQASRAMVVTPFLSSATSAYDPIARIAHHFDNLAETPILITRRSSIAASPKMSQKLESFSAYAIRDDLVTAEFEQEDPIENNEGDTKASNEADFDLETRDIHAKAYLFERANSDGKCDLFVGSANASTRGLHVNNEAMAHLAIERSNSFDRLLKELGLTQDELERGSLFEPLSSESLANLNPPDEDEMNKVRQQQEFDRFLRRIELSMRIKRQENSSRFEAAIEADGDFAHMRHCTIALATGGLPLPLNGKVVFTDISLEALTELVRITSEHDNFKSSRLMRCKLLEGAEYLNQQRRQLFKTVTKGRFSEYLEFRLSGNPELVASISGERGHLGSARPMRATSRYDGLYENLLRSYAAKPQQTDTLVSECLKMLSSEHDDNDDKEIELIRQLLEIVQRGARYAN